MELKHFWNYLKKRLKSIIIVSLSLGVLGGVAAAYWPVKYSASLTLYVNKLPEVSTHGDYSYDGFYAQQAAESYTDTVVGLLESPDLMATVVSRMGLAVDGELSSYERSLNVQKNAPQVIQITVTRKVARESVASVTTLAQVAKERVESLNSTDGATFRLELVDDTPIENTRIIPPLLTGIVSALFGVVMAGFGLMLEFYIK